MNSMLTTGRDAVYWLALLAAAAAISGCAGTGGGREGSANLVREVDLGVRIGDLVEVVSPEVIGVEGFGLVGGLAGTGSAECPTKVRTYLKRYISARLPEAGVNVDSLIGSLNTAVVRVDGMLPVSASTRRRFDLRVAALATTQTTSLAGGWLYGAELWEAGTFGMGARVLGAASGPVFTDDLAGAASDPRAGYILGGGRIAEQFTIVLGLRRADYVTAGAIRNRLNERFGDGTARAVAAGRIELTVPLHYVDLEDKFILMVKATYLDERPQIVDERISSFIRRMATSPDKYESEIALETIGTRSIDKLAILLNSSNEEVRFHAARCILSIGSDRGLGPLLDIAFDVKSTMRLEAIAAIGRGASRNDAVSMLRKLLRDRDFGVSMAAYEQLQRLGSAGLTRDYIGRSFYLEQVADAGHAAVVVSRSGEPKIVLFGSPLRCRTGVFVESRDQMVTIDAPPGRGHVTLIRRSGRGASQVSQLSSSYDLADIVRRLCAEPPRRGDTGQGGLGVSFSQVTGLLKQLCDRGAVNAEFVAGPLPKIGLIIK